MGVDILQLEVEPHGGEGSYRILVDGESFKYLTIDGGIYDEFEMCFPQVLVNKLPPLPRSDWNVGHIGKRADSDIPEFLYAEKKALDGVRHEWHPLTIDILSLHFENRILSSLWEATSDSFTSPVIAKFARFEWEIPFYDQETEAYRWLQREVSGQQQQQQQHQAGNEIAPRFLGHLAEEGRIIGFLLERIEGHHAEPDDLPSCREVLSKLHGLGIIHGDVNKYNFIVSEHRTVLIDYKGASKSEDKHAMRDELESLEAQLLDDSGKGGHDLEYPPGMYEEMMTFQERDDGCCDKLRSQARAGKITITSEENRALLRKQRGESP